MTELRLAIICSLTILYATLYTIEYYIDFLSFYQAYNTGISVSGKIRMKKVIYWKLILTTMEIVCTYAYCLSVTKHFKVDNKYTCLELCCTEKVIFVWLFLQKKSLYKFNVLARDHFEGGVNRQASLSVYMYILDVNDNKPVFQNTPYHTRIPEVNLMCHFKDLQTIKMCVDFSLQI